MKYVVTISKVIMVLSVFSLTSLFATSSFAGDAIWLENRTDEQFPITVYHSKSCGCCKAWIKHLHEHNFQVNDVAVEDVNVYKKKYSVPPQGAACHTAVSNGKVIEWHVPAQDIKQLLQSESNIRMLAVPGMPSGSPGMDGEGSRKDSFKVYAVTEQNEVSVYREYPQ